MALEYNENQKFFMASNIFYSLDFTEIQQNKKTLLTGKYLICFFN